MLTYPQLRMFARCPGLCIQANITSAGVRCPLAMFSPALDQRYPALVIRVAKSTLFGVVWSKYPRLAMSVECPRAAFVSRVSMASGRHPTLARSAFTIWSTIDSAAALPVCVPPPFGRPMVRPGDGGGVGGGGELLAIPGSGAFAGGCAVGLPVGPPYGAIAGSVVVWWIS